MKATVLTKDKVLNDLPKELEGWVVSWNHNGFFVEGKKELLPFGTIWYKGGNGVNEFILTSKVKELLAKAQVIEQALQEDPK